MLSEVEMSRLKWNKIFEVMSFFLVIEIININLCNLKFTGNLSVNFYLAFGLTSGHLIAACVTARVIYQIVALNWSSLAL